MSGATVSTVQVWLAGVPSGVARHVDGAHAERVLAVSQPAELDRAGAGRVLGVVQSALETRHVPSGRRRPPTELDRGRRRGGRRGPESTVVRRVRPVDLTCPACPARLSAWSAQVPSDSTKAPSVSSVTTTSVTSVAMPDCTAPVSEHSKSTVTSVRFQPAAFGAGVTPAERMTGGVMSSRTVAVVAAAALPATSVQPANVKSVPAVSSSRCRRRSRARRRRSPAPRHGTRTARSSARCSSRSRCAPARTRAGDGRTRVDLEMPADRFRDVPREVVRGTPKVAAALARQLDGERATHRSPRLLAAVAPRAHHAAARGGVAGGHGAGRRRDEPAVAAVGLWKVERHRRRLVVDNALDRELDRALVGVVRLQRQGRAVDAVVSFPVQATLSCTDELMPIWRGRARPNGW